MVQQPLDKVEKFSYKTLITIVIVLLIGIVALLRIQQKPSSVLAEWFNDAWMYRQAINISTHSVGETNVYISTSVNIGTTAKSQSDNGDFRFTTASGQLLDYYIVSGSGTTNVSFHINFDSFPAGAQTIYAYYGNSSADNGFSSSDFSTVASSYSIGSPASEEIGGGPVAWYKFDEGVGTSISNSASNRSLIGYLTTNVSWAQDSECLAGKCVSMAGTSVPNVTVYDNTQLDFDTNSFTVQMWGLHRDFTYPKAWFMAYKSGTCYSAGHPGWDIGHGYNANGINICYSDGTNLVANASITFDNGYKPTDLKNKWTMLSVVFDKASNRVKFYVNGVKQSNEYDISSVTGSVNNSSSLIFGTMYGWNTDGKIDETKVYSYARTANQIKQDYTAGISGQSSIHSSSNFGGSSAKGLSDGLVGYWKFNEGVGTTSVDSSGNSYTATFGSGDSSPGWSNGKYGVGVSFDASNDYISTSLHASDWPSKTFSAWVNLKSYTLWGMIAMEAPAFNSNTYTGIIQYAGQKIYLSQALTSGTPFTIVQDNLDLPYNQWVHVAGTIDKTSGTMRIYMNGNLVKESKQDMSSSTFRTTSDLIKIGGGTGGSTINGLIDEVRIYNKALSPSEIKNLYNYAPSPIAYWNFDEGSGTTSKDQSGNNRTATLQNGAGFAPGKYGHALSLNIGSSASQYASISNINHNYSFTKEAWIYPIDTTQCGETRCSVIGPYFEIMSNLQYYDYSMAASPGWHQGGSIPLNKWSHIAVTYDQTTLKLLINGAQVYTTNVGSTNSHNSNYIGSVSPTTRNFRGQIDEVKIYDYARTTEQILQDMAGDSSVTPHTGKPLIWYKFDEAKGSLVNNSGVGDSLYHADFGNGDSSPTWVNGKNNKGINFDGFNDSVSLNSFYFPNSENFTLSSWFNINTGATTVYDIPIFGNDQYTSLLGYVPSTKTFRQLKQYTGGVGSTVMNWVTSYQYADSKWHYAAVSVDQGNSTATLYLDGKKFNTMSIGGTEGYTHSNGAFRRIGRNYGLSMNGSIDEMKVYNYNLSDDEIKSDYNQASSFVFGSSNQTIGTTTTSLDYCVPGDTSPCSSPIAEYKMDEGVGTTIYNSGSNNTAHLSLSSGTSSPTWSNGKNGKGLSLDGNDYAYYPKNLLTSTNNLTISSWFKTSSINAPIISEYQNSSTYLYRLSIISSKLTGCIGVGNVDNTCTPSTIQVGTSSVVNDNQWHLGSLTYDGTNVKLYLDGQLITQYAKSGNLDSNYVLYPYIGAIGYNTGSGFVSQGSFLNGSIDQVRIYNYARTPAQIAYDYNKGGPVGWWKLDECQGSTANDSSGIGNNGSISISGSGSNTAAGTCSTASTAWGVGSTGKQNSSMNFDGNGDYIEVADNPSLNLTGSFSLSTWVKPQALPQYTCLLERGTAITSRYYIWLGYEDVLFGVNNDFSSYDANLTIGEWAHITVVHDSETNIDYVYKNGSLISSNTGRTIDPATTGVLRIGQPTNSTYQNNYYTNGQLDDVRVYNYPLTSTQVKAIYNGGSINFK